MAKILITGANGQLGKKLTDLLSSGNELVLTDTHNMDITNQSAVEETVSKEKPDHIIHGAAYTKVDQAEDEKDLCYDINADGTKNVAQSAKANNATLFYISTDYVFDGKSGFRAQDLELSNQDNKISATEDPGPRPYRETDTPNPLSVYGQTKLEGERFVQEICERFYIIRVSWLFGELPEGRGGNFIETMLRLGKEKEELSIVNDQIGSPTYTKDLVEAIKSTIERKPPYGIYHFSGEKPCSWFDFAKEIFLLSNVKIKLNPIASDQYPQKAKRPTYSYLSKDKIEKALGIQVRNWQEMTEEYLKLKNN